MAEKSLAEQIAELPEEEQKKVFEDFTEQDYQNLLYDWGYWGRPSQTPPDDDWHIFLALAGRGWGKMLGLYTPIPTPYGWKNIGEFKDGDALFDENGEVCYVTKAHPPMMPKKAYRVTFSDGSTIDAGEEHLWTTWTHADRKSFSKKDSEGANDSAQGYPRDWPEWTRHNRWGNSTGIGPKVRTTQEIADTLTLGKRKDLNHSIPLTRPLQLPERALLVSPELLGQWLGCGSTEGVFTLHVDDKYIIEDALRRGGHPFNSKLGENKKNTCRISTTGMSTDLNKIGVGGRKHIPKKYLRASIQQRKDLLAGLCDTDGYFDASTQKVEYCTALPELADNFMELLRSLGEKPVCIESEPYLNGEHRKDRYRITWKPKFNPFHLKRKADRFKPLRPQSSRNFQRMIVSVEEIPARAMRCLTVSSKNSLFLAGEAMIPTHNSRAGAEWIRAEVAKNPTARILLLGRTASDVRDVMVSAILDAYPPEERPEFIPSKRRLEWPSGAYALCTSSESPDQLRGPQADIAWCDELAALKWIKDSSGTTAWGNLLAAVRLGKNPRIFATTTPKRTQLMRDLVKDSEDPSKRIKIVRGSTFENTTLSNLYVKSIVGQYGDSELAKQELHGEMLTDSAGVVFTKDLLNSATDEEAPSKLPLVFIAVDPSVSENPKDECGIVVIGATAERELTKRKAYILEDASIKGPPDVWAARIADTAKRYNTKFIVYEKNQGGALVGMAINAVDETLKTFPVTASKGKMTRAEPVVIAMQQGRVRLNNNMPELVDQCEFFDPESSSYSPDRMDAMVWGVTAALISPPPGLRAGVYKTTSATGRKLPNTIGSGRTRATNSLRRAGRR